MYPAVGLRPALSSAPIRAHPRLEQAAVVLAAAAYTLFAEWHIVTGRLTFQTDARTHEYWLHRFRDPDLFRDPLTEAFLDTGAVPHGFRALYWLVSRVADP